MEILLAVIAIVCGIVGILGAFIPVLPGLPLSLLGLFLIQWAGYADFSTTFFIVSSFVTIFLLILDYIAPIWMTKYFGGSKLASNASLAGMLIGTFFFPPFGMIVGPFVGAFIGELIEKKDLVQSFKVATVTFGAFLLGTGLKFIASAVMLFYIVGALF